MLRLLGISALAVIAVLSVGTSAAAKPLAVCTFQCDATPPLGSPLCGSAVPPAKAIVDPLSIRGLVLLGDETPIVLCAVDWVGIGNGGYDAFREALAKAAGTSVDRVAVHTLHQHDAPTCDFDAEALLASRGARRSLISRGIRPANHRSRRRGPSPCAVISQDRDAPRHRHGAGRESRVQPTSARRRRKSAVRAV